MTLQRYPDGIDGGMFFSKEIPKYFPDWIARARLTKAGGSVTHVVCNDAATLVYLANQACLTSHVGLNRVDALDRPDHMIFDLDPAREDVAELRDAALKVRELLDDLGLHTVVKTSGSKGLHIVVPLSGDAPFKDVRAFSRDAARLVAAQVPTTTIEQRKDQRDDRIFVDWLRNAYAQTAVSPYSLRALPGAPVALPIDWSEVEDRDFHPRMFSMSEALRRVEREPDPWAGWRRRARSLDRPRARLDKELAATRS
jgi:bifunctional non-homologous end joining protein LigD